MLIHFGKRRYGLPLIGLGCAFCAWGSVASSSFEEINSWPLWVSIVIYILVLGLWCVARDKVEAAAREYA